jgi:hypothetical protein
MINKFAPRINMTATVNNVGYQNEYTLQTTNIRTESKQRIPLSKYNQDDGNFDHVVAGIEKHIANSGGNLDRFVKQVPVAAITTTQSWVDLHGGGDAVFPDIDEDYWDYPVTALVDNEILLIDGNHRVNRKIARGVGQIEVLVFPIKTTQTESIVKIRRDKNEKFGVFIDEMEPNGDKLANIGEFELWWSIGYGNTGRVAVQLWHPKSKTMAGYIKLERPDFHIETDKTYVTALSIVHDEFAGKGIVLKGYVALLKLGYSLLSDNLQTEGGMKIWQRLAKTQGINVYAVAYDPNDDDGFIYSAVDPNDLSDANFGVYDNNEELSALSKEAEKYAALFGKLASKTHEPNFDEHPDHDEITAKMAMLSDELDRIAFEKDSYHKDARGVRGSRLMAVYNKKIKTTESIKKPHPKDTLGIKRADMPQVHRDHYPELLRYLKSHGGDFANSTVHASKLKAVQSEFSDAGVEKMMQKKGVTSDGKDKKPLIVSSDFYIIDGHHRWLAAYNMDETVPIMQISLPVRKLFQLVKDFKHTTYKDIHEEATPQPGTDAWFQHWFSRPKLTRNEVDQLKEEAVNFIKKSKEVRNEKTSTDRGSNRDPGSNERRRTR